MTRARLYWAGGRGGELPSCGSGEEAGRLGDGAEMGEVAKDTLEWGARGSAIVVDRSHAGAGSIRAELDCRAQFMFIPHMTRAPSTVAWRVPPLRGTHRFFWSSGGNAASGWDEGVLSTVRQRLRILF